MPAGSFLDVGFAPIVAAMNLGGPIVAGLVALFGATQSRELRRQAPWYGVVANHAGITGPAIVGAYALSMVPSRTNAAVDVVATVGAACIFFSLNTFTTSIVVSVRSGEPIWKLVRADAGAYVNMLALAPVAWLMAQMYVGGRLVGCPALCRAAVHHSAGLSAIRGSPRDVHGDRQQPCRGRRQTRAHSPAATATEVQEIAIDIGRAMKLNDADMEALEWGGLLHDIGKIGVPDSVLLKQERLTKDERMIMNAHPVLGAEIIAPVRRLAPELPIIRHHHEWFNGSGYPDRLVGDEIPRLARDPARRRRVRGHDCRPGHTA